MLAKVGIASGTSVVDGFSLDGRFIASEALPNYLMWEFSGHEENTVNQIGFSALDQDIELISITGGNYVGASGPTGRMMDFKVFYPPRTSSNYPDNYLFQSTFGQPYLPYVFDRGIVLPKGSKGQISFDTALSLVRLIARPALLLSVNNLFTLP